MASIDTPPKVKGSRKRKHTSTDTDKPAKMEEIPTKKKSKKKQKEKTSDSSSDTAAAPVQKLFNSHDNSVIQKTLPDSVIWSSEEVTKLLSNVEEKYSGKRQHEISYRRAMSKIQWESVAVEPHTPEECRTKLTELLTKVNSIRSLSEMVKAVRNVKEVHQGPCVGVKPKPPTSVYMLFCSKYRKKHKGETITTNDLASGYRNLSEKKKKKLESQYEEEKLKYNQEMAKFKEQNPDMYPVKTPKSPRQTRSKEEKCPKVVTPVSLYIEHVMEKKLATNPDADKLELRNCAKAKYASLKAKKQQKWLDKAVLANKDLKARLKAYQDKYPDKVNYIAMLRSAQSISDKAKGKPEKPRSSFKIFSQQNIHKSNLTHLTVRQQQKENMVQWKTLPLSEKMEYEKQALQEKVEYAQKYKAYLQNLPENERKELETRENIKKNSSKSSSDDVLDGSKRKQHVPSNGDHHDSDDEMSDVIPDLQEEVRKSKTATKRPRSSSDEETLTKVKVPRKSSPQKSPKKHLLPSPSSSDSSSVSSEEPTPKKTSVSPKKTVTSPEKVQRKSSSSSSSDSSLDSSSVSSEEPPPKKNSVSPKKAVTSPKKVQKKSSSSSSSDSSSVSTEEPPPKKTSVSPKKAVTSPKKVQKKSSSSSSGSDTKEGEAVVRSPKKTNKMSKRESSSSSSESDDEVLTQKPVVQTRKKQSAPVTKVVSPSPVKTTKSPIKTPAAAESGSSDSDSSDSDSSRDSDSQPTKTVQKKPAVQSSPFTALAIKQVVSQSESSSDSDSDSDSDS